MTSPPIAIIIDISRHVSTARDANVTCHSISKAKDTAPKSKAPVRSGSSLRYGQRAVIDVVGSLLHVEASKNNGIIVKYLLGVLPPIRLSAGLV